MSPSHDPHRPDPTDATQKLVGHVDESELTNEKDQPQTPSQSQRQKDLPSLPSKKGTISSRRNSFVAQWRRVWQETYWWPAETLSLASSLLLFLAIVAILTWFNGREAPSWPLGITLNALVAVLITLAGLLTAIPIASCLGQIKWNHVRRPRSIADFCAINEAGTQPLSALKLLLRGQGGTLALLGAALTILNQALGPFTQQLIQQRQLTVYIGNSTIPIVRKLGDFVSDGLFQDVGVPTRAGIYNGLFTVQRRDYNISVDCPNNCTWPAYTTVALCSSCEDVSDQVSLSDNSWHSGSLSIPSTPSENETMLRITTPPNQYEYQILNLAMLGHGVDDNNNVTPRAVSCDLGICLQTLQGRTINGTFTETKLSEVRGRALADTGPLSTASNGSFTISGGAQQSLWSWFFQHFGFTYTTYSGSTSTVPGQTVQEFAPVLRQALSGQNGSAPAFNMSGLMDNIARSVTQVLRMQNVSADAPQDHVVGVHTKDITVVDIRWAWITLPAIIFAGILALLIATMAQTRHIRARVWKDSTVALMMHGLDPDARQKTNGVGGRADMDELAKSMRVRLTWAGHDWELETT